MKNDVAKIMDGEQKRGLSENKPSGGRVTI